MRLLHAKDLEFASFPDTKSRPPYAILSHTWGDDEVTYQQFLQRDLGFRTQGYRKIEAACEKTIELGLEYVWIDTICIDKTNNTELSEAIKRMFEWYRASEVCLAYLADISTLGSQPEGLLSSRWFTRGWTLQELIAPRSMLFFDSSWEQIGSRTDLASQISTITGIRQVYLTNGHDTYTLLREVSIAEKMSWASRRSTTKEEDMAYCLFGIFDVNIPLMYGEGGTQAFQRLQMEIATQRFDPTLLAWNSKPIVPGKFSWGGPLVEMPSQSPWRSTCAALVGKKHPWYTKARSYIRADILRGLLAPSPAFFKDAQTRDFFPVNKSWLVFANRLQVSLPKSLDSHPYIVLPCFDRAKPHRLFAIPVARQLDIADGSAYGRSEGPLMVVDADAWDLWPQESVTLDLSLRHVSTAEERVPYILRTPDLPRGVRCTGVSIGSFRQPYDSTIKIKASKLFRGKVKVSLSLKHETSGKTSTLEIAIVSQKWHQVLLPGIRALVQSWYGLAQVQCDYSLQIASNVYYPVVRQEKVLETTILTVELKQSLGALCSIALKLKVLIRSRAPDRGAAVWSAILEFMLRVINGFAAYLLFLYILFLTLVAISGGIPLFRSALEELAKSEGDYSFSTFIGFLILKHILLSSLYLMPRNSSFVFQKIWFINLFCIVSAMFSYQNNTLTYQCPLPTFLVIWLWFLLSYFWHSDHARPAEGTTTVWATAQLGYMISRRISRYYF